MKNSVKITSGMYRGRTIATPGDGTHPMGERERLALFNKISPYLGGGMVIDVFAGSGALGIEALSRGARKVVFVEKAPKAAKIIRENLKIINATGEVVNGDVADYSTDKTFDVVLADPPYDRFNPEQILPLVRFVSPDGIFVLSHPGDAPEIPGLVMQDSRKYAGATLSFYTKTK